MNSVDDSWQAEQVRRNRQCRDAWDRFAGHRQRVTGLLQAAAAKWPAPRLCLLGAGNCNDVDLQAISQAFHKIDLVDWDAEALLAARSRLAPAARERVVLHGQTDLGQTDLGQTENEGELAFVSTAGRVHVAASLCLLSQLIEQAAQRAGSDPDRQLTLIREVRRWHLQLLSELVIAGGSCCLITDFVSSLTLPELARASEADLPRLLQEPLRRGNFFTGTHPGAVQEVLSHDPWFRQHAEDIHITSPWTWDFGPRVYAVYGTCWTRKSNADRSGGTS